MSLPQALCFHQGRMDAAALFRRLAHEEAAPAGCVAQYSRYACHVCISGMESRTAGELRLSQVSPDGGGTYDGRSDEPDVNVVIGLVTMPLFSGSRIKVRTLQSGPVAQPDRAAVS